jgi:hypothetical protein
MKFISTARAGGPRAHPRGAGFILRMVALAGLMLATALPAATLNEDFTTDPAGRGWRIFGDASLFAWSSGNANLAVTWDSSRTNSYFYLPLGTILNRRDDFGFALDLRLADVRAGIDPNKDSTFQLALGFLNLDNATRTNFFRGNSSLSPNLVEFDFFPDTGFGPTVWPSAWSTNSSLSYNGAEDYTIIDLPVGPVMRIVFNYSASNQTLTTSITTNGLSIGAIHNTKLSPAFTDFRVGCFAIESYSDAGQHPLFGGSLLAHGTVDNVALILPPAPVDNLSGRFLGNQWQLTFTSRTNWLYALERSSALQAWTPTGATAPGNGGILTLVDTNPPVTAAFYRVRGERP